MKKSTIWILTFVMAFAFIGLLYVQIMYMENIIKMRNEQFSEIVKRSLYEVSTSLEQDETKYFLEQDINDVDEALFNNLTTSNNENEYSVSTPEGTSSYKIQGNWETLHVEPNNDNNLGNINERYKNIQEVLKG